MDCSKITDSSRFPDVFLTLKGYTGYGKIGDKIVSPAPKDTEDQNDYQSYLLRLWRVRDDEETAWRASLKSSRSGELVGFGSLEDLFEFLQRQTGVATSETARKNNGFDP
jgi:hypothetical protein